MPDAITECHVWAEPPPPPPRLIFQEVLTLTGLLLLQ